LQPAMELAAKLTMSNGIRFMASSPFRAGTCNAHATSSAPCRALVIPQRGITARCRAAARALILH